MPNTFAYIVFFTWPLVIWCLLARYPAQQAIFISITAATLLLPSGFNIDLPLLPPLDRDTITSLSLITLLFFLGKKVRIFLPGLPTKIILGYFAVLVISVELNASPVMNGGKFLPGLTHYDALSVVIRTFLFMMPFFLGRYFLNNIKDTEVAFKGLVMMALLYSLPMLIELRLSPQFQNWVYGFSSTSFLQQMRGEGYRPTVFYGHGLALAFWMSTSLIAAYALHKNKVRFALVSSSKIVIYLFVILILCKTWSALAYAICAVYAISRLAISKQVKWSLLLAGLILLYPVSKTMDIFPDKEIISSIRDYSPERAQSLEFRFENENALLEHALEKPFFGWNSWDRNRIFDSYGKDISVTDGKWVLEFGINGGMGFVFYYLILLIPLFYAAKTVNYIEEPKDKVYFGALALILAVGIIDSIPNTGMGPTHLLLAGALLGQAEALKKHKYLNRNMDAKSTFK